MTENRVLCIGIASRDAIKKRTIAIARGQLRPASGDPRVWFSSLESLAKVLSEKNMLLLELIRNARPRSLAELARLSGRKLPNLSRTLHSMEKFGLVELREEKSRKVPVVCYEEVQLALRLASDDSSPQAA